MTESIPKLTGLKAPSPESANQKIKDKDALLKKTYTGGYTTDPLDMKTGHNNFNNQPENQADNQDMYMNNLEIVEEVDAMIKMITMLFFQNTKTLKVIGDFSDSQFLEGAVTLIRLHELSDTVQDLLDKGINCLDNEKPVEAQYNFKKAESIINYLQASCPDLEFHEYVIVFQNNIAFIYCSSRFGLIDLTLEHISNTVCFMESLVTRQKIRDQNKKGDTKSIIKLGKKIKQKKLQMQLHLRNSLPQSDAQRHEEALQHSRNATELSLSIIQNTIKLAYTMLMKLERLKRSRIRREETNTYYKDETNQENYGNEEEALINKLCKHAVNSEHHKHKQLPYISKSNRQGKDELQTNLEQGRYNMLLAVTPILIELRKRLCPQANEFKKEKRVLELERMEAIISEINMESIDISYQFNGLPNDHFLLQDTMLFILQIKLIRFEDLDFGIDESDAIYEISPISIFEKISWMTISIYSMATEKSFIEFGQNTNSQVLNTKRSREFRIPDSEVDLGKALELCYVFLPHDIPFVIHIFNVYSRTQNTGNLSIPEDKQIDEQVRQIKPQNGGYKSNHIIPQIRNNKFTILKNEAFQKKKTKTQDLNFKKNTMGIQPSRINNENDSMSLIQNYGERSSVIMNVGHRKKNTNLFGETVKEKPLHKTTSNFTGKGTTRSKPEWFVGAEIVQQPEFKHRTNYTSFAFRRRIQPPLGKHSNKIRAKTRADFTSEFTTNSLKNEYRIRASDFQN